MCSKVLAVQKVLDALHYPCNHRVRMFVNFPWMNTFPHKWDLGVLPSVSGDQQFTRHLDTQNTFYVKQKKNKIKLMSRKG